MSLRRSMIFSLGGAPPLDEVGATSSNTLVAFGLRRLSRNYASTVCLDVRNSNGAIGELSFDNNDEVELQDDQNIEYVTKENRLSSNRLTKYEMVRILGERCKQLTMGAKPLIKNYKDLSYDKIAEEEFIRNMIPFKIKRPLPNGKYEIWNLEELSKDHLLSLIE